MLWLVLLVVFLCLLYYVLVKPFDYWTKIGVKQLDPKRLLIDNWMTVTKQHCFSDIVKYFYEQFPKERYSGMYQFYNPILVIRDPDLIKQITVKDFDHFTDHSAHIPDDCDPLWTRNMFSLRGNTWRHLRSAVNPLYTSNKLRAMFNSMCEFTDNFISYFDKMEEDLITVDLHDSAARFTNDIIAATTFGIKLNSLEDRDNPVYLMGQEASDFKSYSRCLKFFGYYIAPQIYKYLGVSIYTSEVSSFFRDLVQRITKSREDYDGVTRPDMVGVLQEARKMCQTNNNSQQKVPSAKSIPDKGDTLSNLTNDDITANALVLYIAGFHAVSFLVCFTSYELAVNKDVQDKLRREIRETYKKTDGKLTYDDIVNMKYLNMVILEMLRKWPNALSTDRVCTKPYTIEPVLEGEKPLHLEVGTLLWLPIFGIHRDPNYFPDPDKFDPERFSDENKGNILPYTNIPFGAGPRTCFGSRFVSLEVKTLFCHLLMKYEIVPVTKTKIPVELTKSTFTLMIEGGTWVGMKRLKNDCHE